MGRPYAEELALLPETYRWTQHANIEALKKCINALRGRPLVVIGSGGSVSACAFASRLHETHARLPARVLTPFEFIHHPIPQSAGVLLLSAGGSNPDVLAAAEHAIASEFHPVVGLCARAGTPLRSLLAPHRHANVFEFLGPSVKDGFLATNSLLLTCALLARAYGAELPVTLPALGQSPTALWGSQITPEMGEALSRPHIIALAEGWAVTAAIDLESKWAESGFGTVTITDARNFAHGRHYGFSRQLINTFVLGLGVTDCSDPGPVIHETGYRPTADDLLERTLARLPESSSVSILRSPLCAEAGALDLLVRVIYLAGEAGRRLGLDPGRPRVPAFGRALYKAGIPRSLLRRARGDDINYREDLWIRRKVTPVVWASAEEEVRENWRASCREWISAAELARIGGVVLDYDGTLCEADERFTTPASVIGATLARLVDEGIILGIATGRGDSVLAALRAVMPERLWPAILIGMYNGGVCSRLNQEMPVQSTSGASQELAERVYALLSASPVLAQVAHLKRQLTQIAVHETRPLPEGLLYRFVTEILDAATVSLGVRVFSSGHSVDVTMHNSSKLHIVMEVERLLAEGGQPDLQVMTIGDQGQAGGNDASFLSHTLGLSVEHTSSAFDRCWNVAPQGARRTAALLGYLNALRPQAGRGFRWSVAQASRPLRPEANDRGATDMKKCYGVWLG